MSTAIIASELSPPSRESTGSYRPNEEEIELIKNTLGADLTKNELELGLYQARRTGLDPLSRQIYFLKIAGKLSISPSIDGFRLIAERSGKYGGQKGPYWCGADGEWKDVWLDDTPPHAAKVGVLRSDFQEPMWAVARFKEYCQKNADGTLNRMWAKMAATMIAKCTEALALRKAFPHELSGLYTRDEMAQAENDVLPPKGGLNANLKAKQATPSGGTKPQIKPSVPKDDSIREIATYPDGSIDVSALVTAIQEFSGRKSDGSKWTRFEITLGENLKTKTFDKKTAKNAEVLRDSARVAVANFTPPEPGAKYQDYLLNKIMPLEKEPEPAAGEENPFNQGDAYQPGDESQEVESE